MNTEQIMKVALERSGLKSIPADSGIALPVENIQKVAFGVDIDTSEVMLAKQLGCQCVITHHPQGKQRVQMYEVMDNQVDRMVKAGVPINKAEKALAQKKDEVERAMHVSNYDRAVNSAELLNIGFMSIHSPADHIVENNVQNYLDYNLANNPKATVQEVVDLLMEIPEYKKTHSQPKIRVGSPKNYAGKVFVVMAGGTGGGKDVAKAYFDAGVGTLVMMHVPEDVIKAVKEQNIGNIIVAGHMASDSIGINGIIEALEAKGLEVIRMSGVIKP